jgi:hypothetical protein
MLPKFGNFILSSKQKFWYVRSLIRKAPQSVFMFPVILKTNSDSFHEQQEI